MWITKFEQSSDERYPDWISNNEQLQHCNGLILFKGFSLLIAINSWL